MGIATRHHLRLTRKLFFYDSGPQNKGVGERSLTPTKLQSVGPLGRGGCRIMA